MTWRPTAWAAAAPHPGRRPGKCRTPPTEAGRDPADGAKAAGETPACAPVWFHQPFAWNRSAYGRRRGTVKQLKALRNPAAAASSAEQNQRSGLVTLA